MCGGTGLYIKAALYDYAFEDEDDVDCSDLEKLSNDELYYILIRELYYQACLLII